MAHYLQPNQAVMHSFFTYPVNLTDAQNYYYFDNGFSIEELHKVSNQVNILPFNDGTVVGGIDKKTRTSSVKWIPTTSEFEWLYKKMMDLSIEANNTLWQFDLKHMPEGIQYTEYYATEGGHYTWHQDIGPGILSQRKVSITVQLSDTNDYEGGDLEIWQGGDAIIKCPRGKGTVVIFPSYMMHRVTPITKGTRKSFVLWVGGEHYK